MTQVDFDAAANKWLTGNISHARRFLTGVKGLYYNKAPQRFRFFGLLHWGAKTSLAASAPGLAYYYGSIAQLSVAIGASAFILFANGMVALFDALSKDKASASADDKIDVIVRFGDLLAAHQQKTSVEATARDDAIRACLGILEIYARQTTKAAKGTISTSVVLYKGSSRTTLQIRHRNPGNERPTGRDISSEGLLGHFVCEHGASPQVIHDIRELKAKRFASPTQSKVEYRSIFFYPLEVDGVDGKFIKGFISIDCKKPYAFYGNRSNDIVVTCEPILSHVRELIQEPQNARRSQKAKQSGV